MKQHLSRIEHLLEESIQITDHMQERIEKMYQEETGNEIKQFESAPIPEQQDDREAYDDKINYKSTIKLIENLKKMENELNHLRIT